MNEINHFKNFILCKGDVPTDVDHLDIKRIHLESSNIMVEMCGEWPPVDLESWDFRQGRRFEDFLARLGSSVHHTSSTQCSFFLLVVFRRSSFGLTEESIGMALH
jgi:hypothetical protein